jgi:hypothetical protein
MKLKVDYNKIGNYKTFLRRAGYALIFDRRRGQESFVRRLGEGYYPRIHLYAEQESNYIIFNIHLDQKKASYEGTNMHSAEYDSDVVKEEVSRLREVIGLEVDNNIDSKIIPEKKSYLSGNLEDDLKRLNVNNQIKKRFWFFKR